MLPTKDSAPLRGMGLLLGLHFPDCFASWWSHAIFYSHGLWREKMCVAFVWMWLRSRCTFSSLTRLICWSSSEDSGTGKVEPGQGRSLSLHHHVQGNWPGLFWEPDVKSDRSRSLLCFTSLALISAYRSSVFYFAFTSMHIPWGQIFVCLACCCVFTI